MFTRGAGVVQMGHLKKMGIHQEDSWLDFISLLSVAYFFLYSVNFLFCSAWRLFLSFNEMIDSY